MSYDQRLPLPRWTSLKHTRVLLSSTCQALLKARDAKLAKEEVKFKIEQVRIFSLWKISWIKQTLPLILQKVAVNDKNKRVAVAKKPTKDFHSKFQNGPCPCCPIQEENQDQKRTVSRDGISALLPKKGIQEQNSVSGGTPF